MGNHTTTEHPDSKKLSDSKRKMDDTRDAPVIHLVEEANIAPTGLDITSSGSGEFVTDFDLEAFLNVFYILDYDDKE